MDERICHTCGFTYGVTDPVCPACGAPVGFPRNQGDRRIGRARRTRPVGDSGGALRPAASAAVGSNGRGDPRLLLLAWVSIALVSVAAFLPWARAMDVEVAGIVGAGRRAAGFAVITALVFAFTTRSGAAGQGRRWGVVVSFALLAYTFIFYVGWLVRVATWESPLEQTYDVEIVPGLGLYVGAVFGFVGTCAVAFWGRSAVSGRTVDS